MTDSLKQPSDARLIVEASAWRVRLADVDGSELASVEEFQGWLAEDPRHLAAWKQVDGPWQFVAAHASAPEMVRARDAALARAQRARRSQWLRRPAGVGLRSLLAAAAVLVAVTLGVLLWQGSRFDEY